MMMLPEFMTVNATLVSVVLLTLLVWLLQEMMGRRCRLAALCANPQEVIKQGGEAGFPPWLQSLSYLMLAAWGILFLVVYLRRDGDFAVILTTLVLLSGVIFLLDRQWFRQRRVVLMTGTLMQQAVAQVKTDEQRQQLTDWAEKDFLAAEYAKSFFPVLLVVLVLRSFLLEPFKIPSASMVPTLEVHDFIIVNKFAYGLRLPVVGTKILDVGQPQRGDVMVFFPPNDKRYFIKRVIGLPGDEIRLEDNVLYINGVRMEQSLVRAELSAWPPHLLLRENLQPVSHLIQRNVALTPQSHYQATVPAGQYFMMGDNRDNSSDSRFWGMVPEKNIVGRAVYVWMHWESFGDLPSFARNGVIN